MILRVALTGMGLIFSSGVFAAVTITVPADIKVVALNDQEVGAGFIKTEATQYKVDAGVNSISMRYIQYFEQRSGDHDIIKSGVVTLTTPSLNDGEHYALKAVNVPAGFEAVKKYAEQPVIGLYNKNNQLLVQQAGVNTEQKPWLSRGLFGSVVDLTQKKTELALQPAPVYMATETNIQSVTGAGTTKAEVPVVTQIETGLDQQLISIWKKASKVERQKFMTWLATQ